MANTHNLIPNEERTPEERRENARKAGKASGAARRKKKAMRQAAAELLNMSIPAVTKSEINSIIKQRLQTFGYDPEDATYQDAMLVAVMMRALKGDVRASEFIRDTAGHNPSLDIKKQELKLRKEELKLKRETMLDSSKPERDENNLLDAIKGVEEIDTDDLPEVE